MLLSAIERLRRRLVPPMEVAPTRQAGAIPYAVHEGRVFFLLITSRRTGRWIFPKGSLMAGLTPSETAAQETFEEAGVRGAVDREPVGFYHTVKVSGTQRTLIAVDMYPLRVEEQLDDWPERGQRYRHWVGLAEARRLLDNRSLAAMTLAISRRHAGLDRPAA